MAQNENISLSLANKIDVLNKSQSLDARYGVYDSEIDALSAMQNYGLDGRQVAVYTDKPNGKVRLYLYNQVEHKLDPVATIPEVPTLQEVLENGSTASIATDFSINADNFKLGENDSQLYVTNAGSLTVTNAGSLTVTNGANIDFQGGVLNMDYSNFKIGDNSSYEFEIDGGYKAKLGNLDSGYGILFGNLSFPELHIMGGSNLSLIESSKFNFNASTTLEGGFFNGSRGINFTSNGAELKAFQNNDEYTISFGIDSNKIAITEDGLKLSFTVGENTHVYTLPNTDGTANQALVTDGNGNVTFQDVSGSVAWDEITGDQSDINLSGFTNDLGLATVATTGDYDDLNNKPTIPAQVNLIEGSNITISGTYPNLTLSASGTVGTNWNDIGGDQSDVNISGFTNDSDFITENQTITLSGDVTGSGTTAINTTITDNSVTNAKLADMATNTVKVRAEGTTGDPTDLRLDQNNLLGRGSTGNIARITLGTNLSFDGTVLNATGGGATVLNDLSDVDVDGGQSDRDVLAWSSVDEYFTPVTHIGEGGSAHALATTSEHGFMPSDMYNIVNNLKDFNPNSCAFVKFTQSVTTCVTMNQDVISPISGVKTFSAGEMNAGPYYEGELYYTLDDNSSPNISFTLQIGDEPLGGGITHSLITKSEALIHIKFNLYFGDAGSVYSKVEYRIIDMDTGANLAYKVNLPTVIDITGKVKELRLMATTSSGSGYTFCPSGGSLLKLK